MFRPALLCYALATLAAHGAAAAEPVTGYGPWKLGMSKDDVRAVKDHGPYTDVRVTGGLETSHGFFDGQPCTVSFVFDDSGLRKIQIWAYEGQSAEEAIAAWSHVYDYFRRTYGEVENAALKLPPAVDKDQFVARLRQALDSATQEQPIKIQMAPAPMPEGIKVFSSIFRIPGVGYDVFVYYQR